MSLVPLFDLESKAEIAALKQVLDEKQIAYRIGDNNENMRGMSYGRDCVFLFPPRVWGDPQDADEIEAVLEEIRKQLPPPEIREAPPEGEEPDTNFIGESQIRSGKQKPLIID